MNKIMSIILFFTAFSYAMDNKMDGKKELIEKFREAWRNPQNELAQTVVYLKRVKSFDNKGKLSGLRKIHWDEIEKGNFVHTSFYTLQEGSPKFPAQPLAAIIVGTEKVEDAEILKNLYRGYTCSMIAELPPASIYNIINQLSQRAKL